MTKYHVGSNGHYQRCKATVRNGQNVSGCPLELDGAPIAHTVGLEGIAAAGGGTIRRWIAEDTYRDTKIMVLDADTFMTSTGKLERVYAMSGKLLPLKERLRALKSKRAEPESTRAERPIEAVPEFFRALHTKQSDGSLSWSSYAAKRAIGERELALRGESGLLDPQGRDFYDIPEALTALGARDFDATTWQASSHRAVLAKHYPNVLSEIEADWEALDLIHDVPSGSSS